MRVRDGLKVNGAETVDFYKEQMFSPPEEDLCEVVCQKLQSNTVVSKLQTFAAHQTKKSNETFLEFPLYCVRNENSPK